MKKIVLPMISMMLLFFVFVTPVKAAGETVTIGDVTAYASSMSVSGTTDAVAVTIQVRDASGIIVAMDTVGTKGGKFSKSVVGSYTVGGNYKIYVADYEGGTWDTKDVTAAADPVPPATPGSAPDSGDSGDGDDNSGSNSGVTPTTPAKTPAPEVTPTKQSTDKNTTKKPDASVSDKDKKDSATDKNKDADVKKPSENTVGDGKDTGTTDTTVLTNPSSQDDVKTSVGMSKSAKILMWTLLGVIIAAVITGFIILLGKRKKG